MSDSLLPHESQHARPPCPSPTPTVHSDSHPWVSDAIQPFHPLSSPSPLAFSLSQHQGLFNKSVLCIRWPKYWSFSFSTSPSKEHSGLISFRIDWFDLFAVQGTLSRVFSTITVQKHQFFDAQFSLWTNSDIHTWLLEKPLLLLDRPLLAKYCLCFLVCCLGLS